jgi:hypothetical protein
VPGISDYNKRRLIPLSVIHLSSGHTLLTTSLQRKIIQLKSEMLSPKISCTNASFHTRFFYTKIKLVFFPSDLCLQNFFALLHKLQNDHKIKGPFVDHEPTKRMLKECMFSFFRRYLFPRQTLFKP